MDAIRSRFSNPLIVGVLAFLVGLLFGLVVLGWWLWPVEWKDADPSVLNADYKEEYLRMAIQAYSVDKDLAQAQARFKALGGDANKLLSTISQDAGTLTAQAIADYSAAVQAGLASTPAPGETPAVGEKPEKSLGSILLIIVPILCVLVLAFGAVVAYLYFFRKKPPTSAELTPAQEAEEIKKQATWTDYTATGEQPPVAQYMASYKFGDNLFDDSFSIDSAVGEFLGECGVGISETIGVGEPKKVTAFEVWLFDKNDIQTVTKVLMSTHAYHDSSIRQRVQNKGEPILVEPGATAELETQSLRMVARVVNMAYGQGAMPSESFFDQFVLELAVWQK